MGGAWICLSDGRKSLNIGSISMEIGIQIELTKTSDIWHQSSKHLMFPLKYLNPYSKLSIEAKNWTTEANKLFLIETRGSYLKLSPFI